MKNRIVLIGGGGHCKSVVNTICRTGHYDEIVIVDKDYPKIDHVLGISVVGDDSKLSELKKMGFQHAFITIGSIKSTRIRRLLYQKAVHAGFHIPYIVDPSAQVSKYSELKSGVFVGLNAVINAEVCINRMAIINTAAVVEHECTIGEYSHISVGAKLCGNVSVGSDVLIGAGAVVIQGLNIGQSTIVGAGSVVLKDVQDGQTVVGLVR